MKNVIIIHGCPSDAEKAMDEATRTYDKHWIPWVKEKLTEKGIAVETPLMPEPWTPVYSAFKKEFERKSIITPGTILVGHSCGTTFLTRWLGETKQDVAKLILVAPWCIADEDNIERREFYEQPIDETIKDRVKEIIIFTSDNEEDDGKKSVEIFKEKLHPKVIELKGHGHFVLGHMGTNEFPELLEEILNT